MPPKRRKVKESEEELALHEKLTEAFFKYRCEDEDENVGMFATKDEPLKIRIEDIERVVMDIGMKWDDSLLAILNQEQKETGLIGIDSMKLILATLQTLEKQKDDIDYLFKTFSDPSSNEITQESLTVSLKHLSIRESNDKIALLLAFGHEQSFLQLILSEQTTGQPISTFANRSGLSSEEFKRTFIRSTFLANK